VQHLPTNPFGYTCCFQLTPCQNQITMEMFGDYEIIYLHMHLCVKQENFANKSYQ